MRIFLWLPKLFLVPGIKFLPSIIHKMQQNDYLYRVHLNMTNVYSPVTTILSNGPRGFIIIISENVEF